MNVNSDPMDFIKLNGKDAANLALDVIPVQEMELIDNKNNCIWTFHKQDLVQALRILEVN